MEFQKTHDQSGHASEVVLNLWAYADNTDGYVMRLYGSALGEATISHCQRSRRWRLPFGLLAGLWRCVAAGRAGCSWRNWSNVSHEGSLKRLLDSRKGAGNLAAA